MEINKLAKLFTMVAVVAIVFGVYASTGYGQETSTTDDTIAPANPVPPTAYLNVGKGYKIGGGIVLAEPGGANAANVALGYLALHGNTTGYTNTASGAYALNANTTGFANTASGNNVLFNNLTGSNNTAIGSVALEDNTTGSANTASGATALYSNTKGNFNTASGFTALYGNTEGNFNTAIGYQSLLGNTTGNYNTAIGLGACSNLIAGSNVTCIGGGAGPAGDIPGPATYIAGIYGAPTIGSGNPLVCVDSTGLLGTTGCASMDNPHERQEIINHQQVQIETLQRQNEELRQRMSRLEALIAKK